MMIEDTKPRGRTTTEDTTPMPPMTTTDMEPILTTTEDQTVGTIMKEDDTSPRGTKMLTTTVEIIEHHIENHLARTMGPVITSGLIAVIINGMEDGVMGITDRIIDDTRTTTRCRLGRTVRVTKNISGDSRIWTEIKFRKVGEVKKKKTFNIN